MRQLGWALGLIAALVGGGMALADCGGDGSQQAASGSGELSGRELQAAAEAIFGGEGVRWVDMTHTLDEENVYWPTARQFELERVAAGETEAGYWYAANNFSAAEHGGTHLDAPWHFAKNGWQAHEIPLNALRGRAAVIDVRDSASVNRDYRVSVRDLEEWEDEHGRLPEGAVVLINTGWQERWPDEERVLGTSERGEDVTDNLHFPGLHPDAARWLVENRDVDLVGLDTPSIDYGPSTDFMSHRVLYEANVVGLENVANLDQLPASGAYVMVLPMKIRGGSGGPARVVGMDPAGSSG